MSTHGRVHIDSGPSEPEWWGAEGPQIWADTLTRFQTGEADYTHQITNRPSGSSNLPTALIRLRMFCLLPQL